MCRDKIFLLTPIIPEICFNKDVGYPSYCKGYGQTLTANSKSVNNEPNYLLRINGNRHCCHRCQRCLSSRAGMTKRFYCSFNSILNVTSFMPGNKILPIGVFYAHSGLDF